MHLVCCTANDLAADPLAKHVLPFSPMKGWQKGCFVVVLLMVAVGLVTVALLGPRAAREGTKIVAPISKMVRSGRTIEDYQKKHPFTPPADGRLTAEQLDRFLRVRKELDALYREAEPRLAALSHERSHSLSDAQKALSTIGDFVPAQMDVFVKEKMTPREYHFVDRIVYGRWRPELAREGTHPASRAAAAKEIESAAEGETDPRVAERLRQLAVELRARKPDPPAEVDPATHQLLLARADDIETYSLEAYRSLNIPPPD